METLDKDGVVCFRKLIPDIQDIIDEYEATEPDLEGIPKHKPIVVYWTHVVGSQKRLKLLSDMPRLEAFAKRIAGFVQDYAPHQKLRLLETIIFNKPPGISNILRWHQDTSYFPFEPNNQLAVWIPFDVVTEDSGAMVYALGSHRLEHRGSSDLHSGVPFKTEDREPIPDDPTEIGLDVRCFEMDPGDMLLHDGRTWHMSGPNTVEGRQRRGLSLRFLVGNTYYKPRGGSAAAFIKQIDIEEGGLIDDPAFPVLP